MSGIRTPEQGIPLGDTHAPDVAVTPLNDPNHIVSADEVAPFYHEIGAIAAMELDYGTTPRDWFEPVVEPVPLPELVGPYEPEPGPLSDGEPSNNPYFSNVGFPQPESLVLGYLARRTKAYEVKETDQEQSLN